MRAPYLAILASAALLSGCIKKEYTINNTNTAVTKPHFTVEGISDMVFINNQSNYRTVNISVVYQDSAQEAVRLSLTGVPAGVGVDSLGPTSGIPTFSTSFSIFDTTALGAEPGTYPASFTITTASGKQTNYPFNIIVKPIPAELWGAYRSSRVYPDTTHYTDSLYQDPAVRNKVWFTNFANTGATVYGMISSSGTITIPTQTVGGVAYHGSSTSSSFDQHSLFISAFVGTASKSVTMN